jgi:hypothetical protein
VNRQILPLLIALFLALPAQAICFQCQSRSGQAMMSMCHHQDSQKLGHATLTKRCCCTIDGLPQNSKAPLKEAALVSAPEITLAAQTAVILKAPVSVEPALFQGAHPRFSSSHFAQTKCAIAVLKSSFLI